MIRSDQRIILSTYLFNLVFSDQFPILGGDLLLQADDLLLQGVDLPHVVHVGPIVSFWRLNIIGSIRLFLPNFVTTDKIIFFACFAA